MRAYLYNLATDKIRGFIPNIFKGFLFFLSLIYSLIVRSLIFFHLLRPYRLQCKVIAIGNITLGGTGKTSLVDFVARYLKQQGHKVAIISRGYKKKASSSNLGIENFQTMGDEPFMLKMNLKDIPVLVDGNRIRAAKLAIQDYGADTVILDDGFQQWGISKDLEIVTVDATNPFGNAYLLPRGILREPLSSLKRADVFIFTKTNLNPYTQEVKDFLNSINPTALIFDSIHQPVGFYKIEKPQEVLKTDVLEGKEVSVVCGIADPDSFENLIASLDIKIGLSFLFPDHHAYSKKDLEKVMGESKKKNINIIVTTEKDAVRLTHFADIYRQLPMFVLRIELKITKDEQEFRNRLLKLYSL